MMEYKGYHATTEYDAEDGVFYGDVVGIRDVIYFKSESVHGLEKEFRASIDDYLEWCDESGDPPNKPFSGSITLYVDPETHRAAVFAAYAQGKNLEDWIAELVESAVKDTTTSSRPEQPAAQNSQARNGAGVPQ